MKRQAANGAWAALTAGLLSLSFGCETGGEGIRLTEFLASNSSGLKDADGETSDWIELFNGGDAAVDLEGWRLTDDPHEPGWAFPRVVLEPGQYLVVFASGKQHAPGDTELHAPFRLKASPDFLALMRRSGRVVQQFSPYPEQFSDVSYGIGNNGITGYIETPTPGAPNGPATKKRGKSDKPEKKKNKN